MKASYISREEAKRIQTANRLKGKVEAYESALRDLPSNQVGSLECKDDTEAKSVKRGLLQVSKLLGMGDMTVRRAGKIVLFYRKSEEGSKETKPRRKTSTKVS
jgi:hypothetical protein